MKRFTALLGFLALTSLSLAAPKSPVVGKWSGLLKAVYTPDPNLKVPADNVTAVNTKLANFRLVLVVDAKGTYTATTKGTGVAYHVTHGTWKLKGKELTLTPSDKGTAQACTLSKDGKSLTVKLPAKLLASGYKGEAVYTRSK